MAQYQSDEPIDVSIPGWIIHRLLIWIQRFTTFYTTTDTSSRSRRLVRSDFTLFDYDLADGTLLDLLVFYPSGVYLQIPRLAFVADNLAKNLLCSLTWPQICNSLQGFDEFKVLDFLFLMDELESET